MSPQDHCTEDAAQPPAPAELVIGNADAVNPEDIDARAFAELDGYGRDWVRRL